MRCTASGAIFVQKSLNWSKLQFSLTKIIHFSFIQMKSIFHYVEYFQ